MYESNKYSIAFKVARTSNKINQAITKALKVYDIAPEQRAILDIIDNDNSISQNDLASILGKDKTTISRALDAIEKKGYIDRISTKEDKRVKLISLTSLGKEALKKSKQTIIDFRLSVIKDLSEKEIETISKLLEKISDNVDRYTSAN